MLSGDAIVQANATLIVGVIFLVNLRAALKLPVTRSFVALMLMPVYFWSASIIMYLWGDMTERSGHVAVANYPLWGWYNLATNFFIAGIIALVVVMVSMYREAGHGPRVV